MLTKWLTGLSFILTLSISSGVQVTKDELNELGNSLWRADRRISHVMYHTQGKLMNNQSKTQQDVAPGRLFVDLPEDVFKDSTTIDKFMKLFDNYERNVKDYEDYTAEEDGEVNDFLNSVLETNVMKIAWDFLVKKELSSPNRDDFFNQLKGVWFTPFKRGGKANSSSGFEHVFMGEVKKQSTAGFHNWIRFYSEEKAGRVNYAGYYDLQNYGSGSSVGLKFFWDPYLKPVSSMFIRSTPEFELAVYTSCFLILPNRICRTQVNGTPIRIQTVEKKLGEKSIINTAYPNIQ